MNAYKLKALDIELLDDVFEMHGGGVLDFTNDSFARFFEDEINVNIDEDKYSIKGGSKAKRLRYFLRIKPPETAGKVIEALWDYRQTIRRRNNVKEPLSYDADEEISALIAKLTGKNLKSSTSTTATAPASAALDTALRDDFSKRLQELANLDDPQKRGYAFEKFLKDIFDAYELNSKDSFRLEGEQIDGSFSLGGETYLLEAKWTSAKTGASDLRSFNGKVEDKAKWSRGLFVSYSGFSSDGLTAFGKKKSIVCMDGLDLHTMIERSISFSEVINKKVRRAAETGKPFVSVRELFPA